MRKSINCLFIFATTLALAACGKLTPSLAALQISKDSRAVFVKLHTGKRAIGPVEQKFLDGGLIEARTGLEIVLTPDGKQMLEKVHAVSCGPDCWNVPLAERADVTITALAGSQDKSETATFRWKLKPNDIGERFALEEKEYEGTAEFRRDRGQWKLVSIDDNGPVI